MKGIQRYQNYCESRGMVPFGDNKAQPVPTKPYRIKSEGSFVDEFGNIPRRGTQQMHSWAGGVARTLKP